MCKLSFFLYWELMSLDHKNACIRIFSFLSYWQLIRKLPDYHSIKNETPIYFYTNEGVTSTKKQVKYKCMEAQTEKYNNKQK